MIRVVLALLLLVAAGCARCPLRMFDCSTRRCPQCGNDGLVWDNVWIHKCDQQKPAAGTKE